MYKFTKNLALITALAVAANTICACAQPLFGDADHSGSLAADDAAMTLSYTLNPAATGFTEEDVFYCDVDADGQISANDAAMILAKVLNSMYVFPAEKNTSGGSTEVTTTPAATETTTQTTTEATTETTTQTTTETTTQATTETTTESTTAFPADCSITVGNRVFGIGQSESSLPAANRTAVASDGIKWFSYTSSPTSYTKVGTANGKVVQILTYDNNATYDGVKIGNSVSGYSSSPALYKATSTTDINIYFDQNDGNKVYAIQLKDGGYLVKNQDFTGAKANELERQIFDMTNAFRAQHGVSELRWSDDVAAVARSHAKDMAANSYFNHQNLEGKKVGNTQNSDGTLTIGRLESAGLIYFACGENIDAGYYTAEAAVDGWINSTKGHRDNLLAADFRYLGVGAAYNENDSMGYKTRFVQNFYTPMG